MQPPHAIRYGTSFKDGKLYEFSPEGILVLRQWPDMRAWRRTPKGRQWQQVRPLLRLHQVDSGWSCEVSRRESKVRPMLGGTHIRHMLAREPEQEDYEDEFMEVLPVEQNEALADAEPSMAHIQPDWVIARQTESLAMRSEFLKSIPDEVLAAVAPYSSRHWHLLNLIARCPGAIDLVRATPALAFALASLWAFRNPAPRQPLRAARALLRKRQPEIAAWLGFPSDRSTMRVLRKLSPAECSIPNLLHLRDLLRVHPKPLRHMRMLGTASLHIMARAAGRCALSDTYLCELGASPKPAWLETEQGLIRDVLWMRETLGETGVFVIHSHAHLQRLHDHLVERVGRMDLKLLDTDPLPEPPFPRVTTGNLHLEPLTTPVALLIEGRAQSNCVGAYAKRIRRGGLYIYQVLAPERATLAIGRTRNGIWRISEIKAPGNAEVMESTRQSVESWLGELAVGSQSNGQHAVAKV